MRDSEVVASIMAGDPEGLAVAYDRYAGDLYGYCRSLLHQPDDAADAVQDTFVIAASKVGGLREPDRLRAWLFAVARNECLRRLKSRRPVTALQDIPEPADPNVDIGVEAERAEAIALVRAAAGGLNDSERDVINQLWHGLEVPEVAAVLGVSRNHAWSLFSRARDQLEASVGVLLVGRTGRRDCAALDQLLGDWDGRLNARLRRKVGRHIDQCRVCSERRQRELRPAMLYGLAPGAVLAMAALRGGGLASAAHAAAQAGGPLAGVRDAVLGAASGPAAGTGGPAVAAHAGAGSALSFTATGFPKPLPGGQLSFLPRPSLPLTVAGGTVAAAAAAVVLTAVVPGHHGRVTDSAAPPPYSATAPSLAPQAQTGSGYAGPGGTGPGSVPGSAGAPGAAARARPTVAPGASGATGPAATGPDGRPVATGSGGATGGVLPPGAPTGTADPTSDPVVPASPTADPGGSDPPATVAAPTAPASAVASTPPSPGTLAVSPSTVLLTPLLGGSMTLTASGGPVSWSIDEPSSLLGQLLVSPASGTLTAGESVTVTITVNGLASVDTQLTIEPGGHTVTVVLGLL